MLDSTEGKIYVLFFILAIVMSIAWLTFSRLTMARIEGKMKAQGLPETFQWDGVGGRVFFYAFAISLPEKAALRIDQRLINSALVRSYASRADRFRGVFFLCSFCLWIIITFIGILVGGQ